MTMQEPVAGPVRLAYMQLVRLVRNGRRPLTAVRRTRLAMLAGGMLLLLIGALAMPSSDAGTPSHSRGTISQLHRLAIEVDSASATGKDVLQAAADQAILAALVSLAAVLAVLIGARQRGRRPAGRLIPAQRGRGPPSDR
jgi:peptidoglycan/LPS O-acetylase OafA/YrhL